MSYNLTKYGMIHEDSVKEREMENMNDGKYFDESTDNVHERLRKARKYLHLSQEFIAKKTGLNRTSITAIELGQRNVSVEELKTFSEIYGVTVDELINGKKENSEERVFARLYSELSGTDKMEIQNLIEFKIRLKKSINESNQN